MKSIKPAICYGVIALLWAGASVYVMTLDSKSGWIMLIFTIAPLIIMAYELYEYRLSRKYYKKFLQEERAKLGLTDEVIETDDFEPEEEEEYDERDAAIIKYEEELEKLEKYDVDSGLDYCAACGNYSVKDGRCEVCGEKECNQ